MESFFSTVKCEVGERFASSGDAKMQLFDLRRSVLDPPSRTNPNMVDVAAAWSVRGEEASNNYQP